MLNNWVVLKALTKRHKVAELILVGDTLFLLTIVVETS